MSGAGPEHEEAALVGWLRAAVADLLGLETAAVDPARPLTELGLGSKDAVGLVADLEDHLDRDLDATLVWKTPTINGLARRLIHGEAVYAAEVEAASLTANVAARREDGLRRDDRAVAVVGVGVRLPGGVRGPDDYWKLLLEGVDAVSEVPEGRWEQFTPAHAGADAVVEGANRWGGFLDDIAGFDAEFFGISPREAELMDPQQRMLLEVAHEALAHAGIPAESLRGTAAGVWVGMCSNEYSALSGADLRELEAWATTGAALSIAANRLSYLLDLRGPSMTLDTACSASLTAVHQACRSIADGEASTAIVGGANLLLAPAVSIGFERAGALAADGRCKTFSADADGIARAEGVGVVILKSLADARRDGDRILAVINGSALNSDGRSNGITAPNPLAQQDVLRAAYANAGIDPATVDYVEAHGTGTLLGDPIEADALGAVLGRGRAEDQPLVLGSAKSNLGHLEGAAGIAGLIKVVLALHHDRIPPSLHFSAPNPHIHFDEARLEVVTEPRDWPRYDGIARAGVSAFGFGGSNAHVVLEEWRDEPTEVPDAARPGDDTVHTLLLSGPREGRLHAQAGALADWLASDAGQDVPLRDVAATLLRRHAPAAQAHAAVTGRGRAGVIDALRHLADGMDAPGVLVATGARRPADPARKPVWVFSGTGSQWKGMGARLLADEPAFAAAIDELAPLVADVGGFDLHAVVDGTKPPDSVGDTQLSVHCMHVALAATWRSYGVEPGGVVGHSMGEVAAAVVSGALTPAEGLRVMTTRSPLLNQLAHDRPGSMAVVEATVDELAVLTVDYPLVWVGVYASPEQQTITGDPEQVERLVEHLKGKGRTAFLMKLVGAGHSPYIQDVVPGIVAGLDGLAPGAPAVPIFSTVLDDPAEVPAFDAVYWGQNARRPVRFTQAVARALDAGADAFLEVSPHPIAGVALRQTAEHHGAPAAVLSTLERKADDTVALRTAVARLYLEGLLPDAGRLAPGGVLADVPPAPWQHRRFWIDTLPAAAAPAGHPLLGTGVELPEGDRHLWRSDAGTAVLPWLQDHAVFGVPVLPGAAYAELALAAATEVLGTREGPLTLSDLDLEQVLSLGEHTELTTSVTTTGSGADAAARVEVFARPPAAAGQAAADRPPMVRHATAVVRAGASELAGAAVPEPVGEPTAVDLYAAFRAAGHRYGPAFTGVGEARLTPDGVATARVALPATATPDPAYVVHPALLDVCLQVLGVAAEAHRTPEQAMQLFLPLGIGALRVPGDPQRGGVVTATVAPLGDDGAGAVGSLRLVADDDTLLLEARDVYLRRLDRAAVTVPLADKLFEAAWAPAPVEPVTAAPAHWLLVAPGFGEDRPGVALAADAALVVHELEAAGHAVTLAGLGDTDELAAAVRAVTEDPAGRAPGGVVLLAPALSGTEEGVGSAAARVQAQELVLAAARTATQLLDAEPARPPRLWVVSRGGAVVADGEAGHPALGGLRAVARVLAFEHAELSAAHVDLDPTHDAAAAVRDLLAELRGAGTDDEVAWRDGVRHARRLARAVVAPAPADAPPVVRDGAYVITGGLGGLGLVVARWLATGGATRIVLGGRGGPSAEAEVVLDELRALGAEPVVVRGDIADAGTADALVAAATAGGLPLRGAVHAAGTLQDEVVARLTGDALRHTWRPKVEGGWRLHEAVAGHDLDFWLVFSSAAALLGSPGQLSYATANAWLDGLAAWRRAQGLAGSTINWGAWSQVGGAADTTNVLLEPLSPAEGVEALAAILADGRVATGVVRLDVQRALALLPGLSSAAFFAPLMAAEGAAEDAAGSAWGGVAALQAAEPEAARRLLRNRLVDRVAAIMGAEKDRLDLTAPLTSLGVDSLMAVRAKNAVEHDFGVTLPVRLLLQGATLGTLEDHLATELGLAQADVSRATVAGPEVGVVEARDPTERWVALLWEQALGRKHLSVTWRWADLGGDETALHSVVEQVRDRLGEDLTAELIFAQDTIEGQSALLRERLEGNGGRTLRTLRAEGSRNPLFVFHPAGSPTSVYQPLVAGLHPDQPVHGFERIEGLRHIEDKAAHYIELMREIQPHGPYALAGWSLGGCLAYDVARQLRAAGEDIEVVAMIDSILPRKGDEASEQQELATRFRNFKRYIEETYEEPLDLDVDELMKLEEDEQIGVLMDLVARTGLGASPGALEHQRTSYIDARIAERYRPQPYGGRVVLYRASERNLTQALDPRYARVEESLGWDELCSDLEVVAVPGDHTSMIDPPNVDTISAHLRGLLDAAARRVEARVA